MPPALAPADRAAIAEACRSLVLRLAWLVDHGEIDEAIGLFADDATIDRDGASVTGLDAITAQFRSRPPRRLTRHVLSNLEVDVDGPALARARCYVTVYRHRWTGDGPALPAPLPGPETLGEYHDTFRLDRGRWRFAARTVRSILDITTRPETA